MAPLDASSSGTVSDAEAVSGTVSSGLEKSCGAAALICCCTVEVVVRSTLWFCASVSELSKVSARRGSLPGSTTVVVVGVTAIVTSFEDGVCSGAGSESPLEHPASRATAQEAATKPERTVRVRSVDFTGTRLLMTPGAQTATTRLGCGPTVVDAP